MPKKSPEVTPEVTVEEENTELESQLDSEEQNVVMAYAQSVVILEKAIDSHNAKGISVIDMFETSRVRLVDAGYPKNQVLKTVYDSASIIANMPEIEIDGVMEPISANANSRMIKELKSVLAYYENGLSIRHTALPFTMFAKLVSLHVENSVTCSKSAIKGCLSVFKGKNPDDLTTAQITDLNKKYTDKVKNLVILAEAKNLAGNFDASKIPDGFDKILKMAESMDKTAINNMIAGLRVSQNVSEGVYKAS